MSTIATLLCTTLEFFKYFCFLIHTKWHATYVRYASSILSPKRFNWSNRIPIRCSGVHAKQNTMEIVKSIRLVRRALSLSSGFSARTILFEFTGYFEWMWRITKTKQNTEMLHFLKRLYVLLTDRKRTVHFWAALHF